MKLFADRNQRTKKQHYMTYVRCNSNIKKCAIGHRVQLTFLTALWKLMKVAFVSL